MSNDNYNEFSKKRLIQNIEKRLKTTMIGVLAILEEELGELWGHDLHPSDRDLDQQEWLEVWQRARVRILDDGHSHLRAAQSELSTYSFKWNRYVTRFDIKGE